MSHFAEIDENNKVIRVLVCDNNDPNGDEGYQFLVDNLGGSWVQTSYSSSFRFNFAGVGFTYDPIDDAFISPMPECDHDELQLNNLKRWECKSCDDDFKQRMASIER
jgi:hypothetical protein